MASSDCPFLSQLQAPCNTMEDVSSPSSWLHHRLGKDPSGSLARKKIYKAIVLLPLFLFNETLSSVLSKTWLFILKFPFEPLKCFKAVEGAVRCFDFCRSEMFHSTRSACVLICQNFSKVSAFSPKTYLYIFYFSEKGGKNFLKKGRKKILSSPWLHRKQNCIQETKSQGTPLQRSKLSDT